MRWKVAMTKWTFDPKHSGAEFCVRHMMVTFVRGHIKGINGTLEFDPGDPVNSTLDVLINTAGVWSGEKRRDDHLRSAEFLDAENHPTITFKSTGVERIGGNEAKVTGNLTTRGVTQRVALEVRYLGQSNPPEGGTRIGFVATTTIDRRDFGINRSTPMQGGGLTVSNDVSITTDVEAILDEG